MPYQSLQRYRYLFLSAVLENVTQVFAVYLPVPEKGAEAGIEDLRSGGEGKRPDLRLVPELAYYNSILRFRSAGIREERDLREHAPLSLRLHRRTVRTVSPTAGVWIL